MSEEIQNFDSVKDQMKISNSALEQKIQDLVNADLSITYSAQEIDKAVEIIDIDNDGKINKNEADLLIKDIGSGNLHSRYDVDNDQNISQFEIELFTHGIGEINSLVNSKFNNLSQQDQISYAQIQFDEDNDGEIDDDELASMQSTVIYSDYTKNMDLDGDLAVLNNEVTLYVQALSNIENSKLTKYNDQVQDLVNDPVLNLSDYVNNNGIPVTAEDQAKYIIARSKFASKNPNGEIETELTLSQQINLHNSVIYSTLDNDHDLDGDLKISDTEKTIYKEALEDLKVKNLEAFNKKVRDIEINEGVSNLEATYLYIIDIIKTDKDKDLTVKNVQTLSDAIEKGDYALKYDLNGDFEVDSTEKSYLEDALNYIYTKKDNDLAQKITNTKHKYNVNTDDEAKEIIAQETFDIFNKFHNESVANNNNLTTQQKQNLTREPFNVELFNAMKKVLNKNSYDKRLDLNNDSKLTDDEVQVFVDLKDKYMKNRQTEFANKSPTDEITKIFDLNEDGQLSSKEMEDFKEFVNNNNNYDLDMDGESTLAEKKLIQDTYANLYAARIAQTNTTVEKQFDEDNNSTLSSDEKVDFIETFHNSINTLNMSWNVYNDLKTGANNHGKTPEEIDDFIERYESATNNLKLDLNHDLLVANDIPVLESKFNAFIQEFENNYSGNLSQDVFKKVDKNDDGNISVSELRKLEDLIDANQNGNMTFNEEYDIDGNLFLTNSELNKFQQLQNTIETNLQNSFSLKTISEQKNLVKDELGITNTQAKIAALNPNIPDEQIKISELEEEMRNDLLVIKNNLQEIQKNKNDIALLDPNIPAEKERIDELNLGLERRLKKISDIDGSKELGPHEIAAYNSMIDDIVGPVLSVSSPNYQEIDFTNASFSSYHSGQDGANPYQSDISVLPEGNGVKITGNTWKKMNFNYNIKSNTVIEFEFKADRIAEIHAIGFDTDNTHTTGTNNYFVGGTQTSLSNFLSVGNNYDNQDVGEYKKYKLQIGNSLAGQNTNYLTFIHDDDEQTNLNTPADNLMSTAIFQNIKIYDDPSNTAAYQLAKEIYAKDNWSLPVKLDKVFN